MLSPLPVFAPGAFWCSTVTALILARMTRCSGARHSTATSLGTGQGRPRGGGTLAAMSPATHKTETDKTAAAN